MKRLKVVICVAFVGLFVGFELLTSDPVSGQAGTIAAPTGVTASDSVYNNKVVVWWDTMRGATLYRVFRNTTNTTTGATDIGTSISNSLLDSGATPGQTFFYFVRAENGAILSSISAGDQGTRANAATQGPLQPLEPPQAAPLGNPVTAAKAYLGKALFWDEQMSSTRTVSCGTCHHSANGGTDPRSVPATAASTNPGADLVLGTPDDIRGSAGVPSNNADGTYVSVSSYGLNDQVTGRKSVSTINSAYMPLLFWDGRATGTYRDPLTNNVVLNAGAALESQAAGPPTSTAEMGHNGRDWSDVASRIAASKPLVLSPSVPTALATWINGRSYPELFLEAFGTTDVTPARISLAIGTYERELYSDQAPVDLDAAGITQISAAAQRGRGVFNASSCNVCHAGNLFTDQTFRYIGVRPQNEDTGRFQVTGNNQNLGEFRVPSLRNVGLRQSFMHNGQFTTLNQVVAFYNRGGDFNAPNKPNNLIRPLGLGQNQQNDLVAFLQSLTDPRVAAESAQFDKPTLYMGSSRQPVITGTGRAGSGGFTPAIRAISPPLAGNPNFTVSVAGGLGNANAVLVINSTDPGVGTTIPTTGDFARLTVSTQNTGSGNGWASLSMPVPATPAVVGNTYFARWYITDPSAANGFSVSQAARFTVFGDAVAPARAKFVDFDGDGKTDISVFRPSEGYWYAIRSGDNVVTAMQFGISTDALTPADYDGDGKVDVAVYRNGTWFIQKSRDGFAVVPFGQAGDIPQPGDYDGDGIADTAVYRPSGGVWYMQNSRDGFAAVQFGVTSDRPVAADFDGDGKTDQAVYRDGIWFVNKSTAGFYAVQFGLATDRPVMGDYDGDGKADVAVFRPSNGTWFILRSSNDSVTGGGFGISTDTPTPGDYDGDGSNDFGVFRPSNGTWFLLNPASGAFRAQQFGAAADKPAPAYNVP